MEAKLITKIEGNKLIGPMSPMEACKEFLEFMEIDPAKMRSVHRIEFTDKTMLQHKNGNNSVTFYGFLLITLRDKSRQFFIDMGSNYCPVCLIFDDDDNITVAPIYERTEFIAKPDNNELATFIRSVPYMESDK